MQSRDKKKVEPCYLRVFGEGNPSLEEIALAVCVELKGFELSFHYVTEKSAAKEMGIPAQGELKVAVFYCQESPVLSKSFVIKGESVDHHLCVEGTYFPHAQQKYGKFVVQLNNEHKEGKNSNE